MPRKKMELDRLSLSLNTDRATPGRHRDKICNTIAKARMGSVLQNARFIHYVWDRPPPRKKEGLGIESIPRSGEFDERCRVKLFLCCSDRFLCQTLTSCLTTKCSGTLEYHKERDTSYPGISRESFLVRHFCSESHLVLEKKKQNHAHRCGGWRAERATRRHFVTIASKPSSAASKVTQPNDPVRTFANLDCNTVQ